MQASVEVLKKRHKIFTEIRSFFEAAGFLEIQTPLLVSNPGLEPFLIPFETEFVPGLGGGSKQKFYLPTSPEYHLKKALALGLDKVFEITRSFRNSELTSEHEPEFCMLEWYRHPGTYENIANDFSELLGRLGKVFAPNDFWASRKDLSVSEAFERYCHLDLEGALSGNHLSLTEQSIRNGYSSINAEDDFETCFHKLMVEQIEPKLGFEGPVFLWDYPAQLCALSRLKAENPKFGERFEVYWKGIELANAFGELTDSVEQRTRCIADQTKRLELYGNSPPLDEEFLESLSKLKHPAGGIAVGLDRLVQCLLNKTEMQEVIAFPHKR